MDSNFLFSSDTSLPACKLNDSDFGRESLGILHPDFGKEALNASDLGRESLGLLKLTDDMKIRRRESLNFRRQSLSFSLDESLGILDLKALERINFSDCGKESIGILNLSRMDNNSFAVNSQTSNNKFSGLNQISLNIPSISIPNEKKHKEDIILSSVQDQGLEDSENEKYESQFVLQVDKNDVLFESVLKESTLLVEQLASESEYCYEDAENLNLEDIKPPQFCDISFENDPINIDIESKSPTPTENTENIQCAVIVEDSPKIVENVDKSIFKKESDNKIHKITKVEGNDEKKNVVYSQEILDENENKKKPSIHLLKNIKGNDNVTKHNVELKKTISLDESTIKKKVETQRIQPFKKGPLKATIPLSIMTKNENIKPSQTSPSERKPITRIPKMSPIISRTQKSFTGSTPNLIFKQTPVKMQRRGSVSELRTTESATKLRRSNSLSKDSTIMTTLSKVRTPSFSQRLNSVRQKSDETPAVSTTSGSRLKIPPVRRSNNF